MTKARLCLVAMLVLGACGPSPSQGQEVVGGQEVTIGPRGRFDLYYVDIGDRTIPCLLSGNKTSPGISCDWTEHELP